MIWLLQYRGQLGHPASLFHLLGHLALDLGLLLVELGVLHVELGLLYVVELGMLAGKVARKLLSLGSGEAAQVTLPAFRLEM